MNTGYTSAMYASCSLADPLFIRSEKIVPPKGFLGGNAAVHRCNSENAAKQQSSKAGWSQEKQP